MKKCLLYLIEYSNLVPLLQPNAMNSLSGSYFDVKASLGRYVATIFLVEYRLEFVILSKEEGTYARRDFS